MDLRILATLDMVIGHTKGRKCAVQAGGNLGMLRQRLAKDLKRSLPLNSDPVLFESPVVQRAEKNIVPVQSALGDSRQPVGVACCRRDDSGRAVHEGLTHVVPGSATSADQAGRHGPPRRCTFVSGH